MEFQFNKHYTRDEARALLPQVREWLRDLQQLRKKLDADDKRITQMIGLGDDVGGETVNRMLKGLAAINALLAEFQRREIQVKDLERGLIDFPGFVAGKEVFLCWEDGEDDIEYWHDLDTGFSGREPL